MIAASSSPAAPSLLGTALLRTQPDHRLACLAAEGSEAAFEEIVRRYRSGLIAFAARISSRDSADDIVQDSLVKAHAALLRGVGPETVRAWLFAIVRNTALNDRRDRRVHDQLDDSQDGVEQPPEAAERRGRLRDLVQAMAKLPAAQRKAIVRRELEGKGHDEIAQELQVSPGAVRQLIFRARSALRAGAGALLPMQLIRATLLSGATEQAGPGAAAGAGLAAKVGIGAIVTTGALVMGTNAVKDEAAHPGQRAVVTPPSVAKHVNAERVATDRATVAPARGHRQRVIVAPKAVSPARTPASPSHPPTRDPQGARAPPGAQPGPQPPPASTGGSNGGQTGTGDWGAQTFSAPNTRDCQMDGSRDPAPAAVSPG